MTVLKNIVVVVWLHMWLHSPGISSTVGDTAVFVGRVFGCQVFQKNEKAKCPADVSPNTSIPGVWFVLVTSQLV